MDGTCSPLLCGRTAKALRKGSRPHRVYGASATTGIDGRGTSATGRAGDDPVTRRGRGLWLRRRRGRRVPAVAVGLLVLTAVLYAVRPDEDRFGSVAGVDLVGVVQSLWLAPSFGLPLLVRSSVNPPSRLSAGCLASRGWRTTSCARCSAGHDLVSAVRESVSRRTLGDSIADGDAATGCTSGCVVRLATLCRGHSQHLAGGGRRDCRSASNSPPEDIWIADVSRRSRRPRSGCSPIDATRAVELGEVTTDDPATAGDAIATIPRLPHTRNWNALPIGYSRSTRRRTRTCTSSSLSPASRSSTRSLPRTAGRVTSPGPVRSSTTSGRRLRTQVGSTSCCRSFTAQIRPDS